MVRGQLRVQATIELTLTESEAQARTYSGHFGVWNRDTDPNSRMLQIPITAFAVNGRRQHHVVVDERLSVYPRCLLEGSSGGVPGGPTDEPPKPQ